MERIFGSFKKRFGILSSAPEYSMEIQARIPPALAGIHNFIIYHDPTEVEDMVDIPDPTPGNVPPEQSFGLLASGAPNQAERTRAKEKRDQIAQAMWESYQAILAEQGVDTVELLE